MSGGSGSAASAVGTSVGSSVRSMTSGCRPGWLAVCAGRAGLSASDMPAACWLRGGGGCVADALELAPEGWLMARWLSEPGWPGAAWLALLAG